MLAPDSYGGSLISIDFHIIQASKKMFGEPYTNHDPTLPKRAFHQIKMENDELNVEKRFII